MDRHVKPARPPFREESEKTRIGAAASDCVGPMIFVEAIDCRAPPRHPALFFTAGGSWPLPCTAGRHQSCLLGKFHNHVLRRAWFTSDFSETGYRRRLFGAHPLRQFYDIVGSFS